MIRVTDLGKQKLSSDSSALISLKYCITNNKVTYSKKGNTRQAQVGFSLNFDIISVNQFNIQFNPYKSN